jgi:DNA anti-recombination protein RmuC
VEIAKTQPATGEYEYFDIKYGPLEEEMGERMVAAFKMAAATRTDMKSMNQDLKESVDSMHKDMNQHFQEMAKKYDVISAELLGTREELKRAVDNLVKLIQKFLEKPT